MVALAQLNHGDGEASRQTAGASRQIENPLSDPFNIFLVPKLRLGTPFCQALLGPQSDDATHSFARRRSQAELGNQKTRSVSEGRPRWRFGLVCEVLKPLLTPVHITAGFARPERLVRLDLVADALRAGIDDAVVA